MKARIMTVGDLIFALTRYPDDMPVCHYTGNEEFAFSSLNGIEVLENSNDLKYDSMASRWENPEVYQGKALHIA